VKDDDQDVYTLARPIQLELIYQKMNADWWYILSLRLDEKY